jgi:sulfocyanin
MKAVSSIFSIIVSLIVAVAIIGASIYAYLQYQSLTSPSSSSTTATTGPSQIPLKYDTSTKTVYIVLVTTTTGPTFNFNNTNFGHMIIYVPAGSNLNLTFINQQSIPHNLVLVQNTTAVPDSPDISRDGKILLEVGTSMSNYQYSGPSGGQSASGVYDSIPAGVYWLACGIAGHAQSGMWVDLVASQNVSSPYVVVQSA